MKLVTSLLLLSLTLFSYQYDFKPKEISKDLWCFLGKLEMPTIKNGGAMSNGCYIKTTKGYVVIDSGPSYLYAKHGYAQMSKIEKLPVITVINTHDHDDHWLGNSFFKEHFNAKLIGVPSQNSNYKEGMKTRMFHLVPEVMEGTKIVKLDEVVDTKRSLTIGDKEFTLIPMGHGHTRDNIVVHLPKEKILLTGDLIMNGRITSNRDGTVIGQIEAIKKIESMDYKVLIPGHGHDTSKDATNESKLYFSLLKKRVLEAIDEDISAGEITKHVTLDEFKEKAMYEILNRRNVFDAYGELEFYEEE